MKKMILTFLAIFIGFTTLIHAEVPTKESVTKLYVATFNRAPDAAGLDYWLNDSGLSLEQISQSFYDQSETQEVYPAGTTATEFVIAVYDNLFNRYPDDAGVKYWADEIESGRIDRSVFILAVINGAQAADATILTNKTIVGLAFADADLNDVYDAKMVMADITDEPETVESSLETITEMIAEIQLYSKSYYGSSYTPVSIPSICDGETCVKRVTGAYAGTDIVTHSEYKLVAIGHDYVIYNLTATDNYGATWVQIIGLSDGQIIKAGEEVTFSLISGLTHGQEAKLQWSFDIEGKQALLETIYFTSN